LFIVIKEKGKKLPKKCFEADDLSSNSNTTSKLPIL